MDLYTTKTHVIAVALTKTTDASKSLCNAFLDAWVGIIQWQFLTEAKGKKNESPGLFLDARFTPIGLTPENIVRRLSDEIMLQEKNTQHIYDHFCDNMKRRIDKEKHVLWESVCSFSLKENAQFRYRIELEKAITSPSPLVSGRVAAKLSSVSVRELPKYKIPVISNPSRETEYSTESEEKEGPVKEDIEVREPVGRITATV